ncbi:MAG: helix-turn-helix domain-containing protein [Gammaproteobacteria bacterium]|nr:MAG: MerR family transcriptional regulator [Gammaproteobacteria bacterium]UCH41027.1 MAG: helix-turn-helix domain-containing protein [Gammaproteobacteria bacterium]
MLTRGRLAARTGCNIETIRYYESIGLMPAPARTATGYRNYSEEHLRRLNFIQRARSLGFSSEKIQGLLELTDSGGDHTRADVKLLTEAHIEEISQKIRDLQKIKRRLSQISSHCDGSGRSAKTCPILESLFEDGQAD